MITVSVIVCTLPAKRGASAEKLQEKAAKMLPLTGLARSRQNPTHRGRHNAQYTAPLHPRTLQVARTLPEEELLRNLREDIAGCKDIT